MAHTLNLVLPLKQDAESKAKLAEFAKAFPTLQGRIAQTMKDSEILHFARIVVVEDKYIMVLTEYDGDKRAYTRFFQEKLPDIFGKVFELAEGAPTGADLADPDKFFNYTSSRNFQPLGDGPDNDGFVFSAYGDATVKEIKEKLSTT